jgi:hypothetical protein
LDELPSSAAGGVKHGHELNGGFSLTSELLPTFPKVIPNKADRTCGAKNDATADESAIHKLVAVERDVVIVESPAIKSQLTIRRANHDDQ